MKGEKLRAINLRSYETTDRGPNKIKWRDPDCNRIYGDLLQDVMRNNHDPKWRGQVVMPSACTNNQCPFYTGRVISFTFEWKGIDVVTTYIWDADDDQGYDTGCEDHEWLTDDMKVNNRNY
jgi:hypothetical protein